MGKALKKNNTLTDLDLSHNRITKKGAVDIAKGLEVGAAIFPFLNGRCHLEQSMPFRATVCCRFHKDAKVLIA